MSDFSIRRMNSGDIAQVARIEAMYFTEPWSEQSFAQELENPQGIIIVAEKDGIIAGFADMREICGECYINNIAVLENYRRQGIGEALMLALEGASSDKAEFITLEVRQSNSGAIALYKKLGYIKVGVRKDFYVKPVENADLMTKIL